MRSEQIQKLHESAAFCIPGHRPDCEIYAGDGAIRMIPELLESKKLTGVFLLADKNTYDAAGAQVEQILRDSGRQIKKYIFEADHLIPDEAAVGLGILHYAPDCQMVIAVGSGVINDIGKIIANVSGKPYMIVATAPSMDGYASATSSMEQQGLKVSVPSKCPDIIIGDTDILAQAPMQALASGLGDVIAKYVSICEWRIAHIITGEKYSADIAAMVRGSLKKCMDNLDKLLMRDHTAVAAVFEGLAICGIAMSYAGLSRPASGCEHYISHVLDMRGAQFRTPTQTHGLQCAMGTLITVKAYQKLRAMTPDREKALAYAASFDYPAWRARLHTLVGDGANAMEEIEKKEGKYDVRRHKDRLEIILANWETIVKIMDEELPDPAYLEDALDKLNAPKCLHDIGTDDGLLPDVFSATRDIRDKYVLSRLIWDLGIPPEEVL